MSNRKKLTAQTLRPKHLEIQNRRIHEVEEKRAQEMRIDEFSRQESWESQAAFHELKSQITGIARLSEPDERLKRNSKTSNQLAMENYTTFPVSYFLVQTINLLLERAYDF